MVPSKVDFQHIWKQFLNGLVTLRDLKFLTVDQRAVVKESFIFIDFYQWKYFTFPNCTKQFATMYFGFTTYISGKRKDLSILGPENESLRHT